MKANEIVKILKRFSASRYNKILIDGQWGIGKTKFVNNFFDIHPDTCYISLFGKKDIESVNEEIYLKLMEGSLKGGFKKQFNKVTGKLKNINFSFNGFTLSIPLLRNICEQLIGELKRKNSFIIVFDDLERKHDKLEIKGILGLVDSLSNIEGIKIVLVANTNNFDDESKEIFFEYNEKSIDRTYRIKMYSDNAPVDILGTEKWFAIKNIASFFDFTNLRTFQKTEQFIEEVMKEIDDAKFTDKFTKDDIYRMCFATIIYNVEHNRKKVLLEKTREDEDGNEDVNVDYIWNYILRRSMDNIYSKSILLHIKQWFENGTYDMNKINRIIKSINKVENVINYLSAAEEVTDAIQKWDDNLNELTVEGSLDEIIQAVRYRMSLAEMFGDVFNFSNEKLLEDMRCNILNHVDIEKSVNDNELFTAMYAPQEQTIKILIQKLNEEIIYEYYNKLAEKIIESFNRDIFSEKKYLFVLKDSVHLITDEKIRENLKGKLVSNKFFFPVPLGKVNQDQMDWCSLSNVLILHIKNYWQDDQVFDRYQEFLENAKSNYHDKMLDYRIELINRGTV
ncbi:P-loop NTPase fold protein [Bacillus safensis]|uniref:P-loop NTPase fold protein n=1 Tax=Bacillus safensis TaxID=561879 RepID=UPI0022AB8DF6|nr:P-loop NTPase fold protein [Bacillus safensis]WAT81935.1 P-loop NTPase fold protein [Bacillus safensis]